MSDPIPDVSTGEVPNHPGVPRITLPTKMREGEVITIRGECQVSTLGFARLPIGNPGEVLRIENGEPKWVNPEIEAAEAELIEAVGEMPEVL
jgi:hypothetical protein